MVSFNWLLNIMKGSAVLLATFLLVVICVPNAVAQAEKDVCAVYFTYVGCPHCATSDPFVLVELTEKYHNLVVIEYEFVLQPENSYVLYDYNEEYDCGTGVPLVIFNKEENVAGDVPILQNMEGVIEKGPNECPLADGSASFEDLDLTGMPGKSKLWTKDRILMKYGEGGDNELLKRLLTGDNLSAVLEGISFQAVEPEPVLLSGVRFPQLDVLQSAEFEHAIKIDNWIFQWNGEEISSGVSEEPDNNVSGTEPANNTGGNPSGIEVDWSRMIISLISAIIIISAIILIYKRVKSRGGYNG
jgi:hypothetical protein